ncbi:MAG: hypothetical protein R2791_13370 [Saprospiraceae bacterium]
MESAEVAKNGCDRALTLARGTGFGFFHEAIAAAMAEFRSGNDFGGTVGTKMHGSNILVVASGLIQGQLALWVCDGSGQWQSAVIPGCPRFNGFSTAKINILFLF